MSRRRFLSVAGGAVAGAAGLPVLSACGGGSSGGSSGGKATVTVASWHWREPGGMMEWWALTKKEFEAKNPDITIEARFVPFNKYFDQAYVELGAGTPADIYSTNQPNCYVMRDTGAMEPLNGLMKGTSIAKDFAPIIEQSHCTDADGKVFMVPMNQLSQNYLYYNEELLEAKGVDVPTSTDEFHSAAQKLNNAPESFGAILDTGTADALIQALILVAMGFGGNWWSQETPKTPTANTPEMVAAMEWYKSFISDGLVAKGLDASDHYQFFAEGRGAMMLSATFALPQVRQINPQAAKTTKVAALPWEGGASWTTSLGCMLAKDSKVKDEAWEYLKFISSPEMQAKFWELTGTPTPFAGATAQQEKSIQTFLDVGPIVREPIIFRVPYGLESKSAEYFKTITDNVQKFLYGGAPIKGTLDDIQGKLEKLAA